MALTPIRWRGVDGTIYRVVPALDVGPGIPRWYLDEVPPHTDVTLGPSCPARLHTLSAAKCFGTTKVQLALVL